MHSHILELNGVYQKYPAKKKKMRTILSDINLQVSPGELVTVVGPTGCGKSTLLRLILGSERPYQGSVKVNGAEVKEPARNRGIVFQQYSLFSNLTVRKNVMFGLELEYFSLPGRFFGFNKSKLKEFKEKADEYLQRVGLLEHSEKYPHELSGGMRQRAAIAQAMVMKPEILLMDEPHGALDMGTREEMQIFVLEQWKQENLTVIFVTHDLEEAVFLGSRIVVLSQFYAGNTSSGGAKIVKDVPVGWELPRPTSIKHSKKFSEIMQSIRHEGLDPHFLQEIRDFDLRHNDSLSLNTTENWD
ncbi:MAG: ABC transporter ATP-binding protein [Fibrobacteria bacterium]|nr:ABC transporter ATP-binding protein [Fibrobacteria bacterium]